MALMKCPDCGKDFSTLAVACPNCGRPVDQQTRYLAIIDDNFEKYKAGLCGQDKVAFYLNTITADFGFPQSETEEEEKICARFVDGFFSSVSPNILEEKEKMLDMILYINNYWQQYKKTFPRCPTCGSYCVNKISGWERGMSIGMWGLGSRKVTKTFKCTACGCMW